MPARLEDYAYCEAMVRRDDSDRWLATFFIPQAFRQHVYALYAFNLEIARVREIVSEPLLGEIRYQWWRDILEKQDGEDAAANPVAAALRDTIGQFNLPKDSLLRLIDARTFDLYNEPMEDIAAFEAYAAATASNLFRLVRLVVDPEDIGGGLGVAEHGGIAYAITGLLRALPWHSARGQLYVPRDILKRFGASRTDIALARTTPEICAALAEMRNLARNHLEIFATRIAGLPELSQAPFLPVALCELYLNQMDKRRYDPFKTPIVLPQWRRQWALWRASRNWRR
jgi:15-cis-phytoene synthase